MIVKSIQKKYKAHAQRFFIRNIFSFILVQYKTLFRRLHLTLDIDNFDSNHGPNNIHHNKERQHYENHPET
jgi:hypothetical protein